MHSVETRYSFLFLPFIFLYSINDLRGSPQVLKEDGVPEFGSQQGQLPACSRPWHLFCSIPWPFACFRVVVIFQPPSPSVISQSPSPPLPSSPQPPWKAVSSAHVRSILYLAFEFWLIDVLIRLFLLRALPGGGVGVGQDPGLERGCSFKFWFSAHPLVSQVD